MPTDLFTEGGLAFMPAENLVGAELLEGETVVAGGSPTPQNPANVNDRNHSTQSGLPAGFAASSITWHWKCDFGAPVEVSRMRVWDPVGSDYWNDPTGSLVEWSDDGSAWTTASTTYSSATVSTGLPYPSEQLTTEYRYTLASPLTHRHWRMRQTAGGGLYSGRAMSEWYVDGAAVGGVDWNVVTEPIDAADGTYHDATEAAVDFTSGAFWRGDIVSAQDVGGFRIVIGLDAAAEVTLQLQGGNASDYSDQATIIDYTFDATGTLTADTISQNWDAPDAYRYYQLVMDTPQDVRVFTVELYADIPVEDDPDVPQGTGGAILEIYVHDEDASRWGTATWATGPATGTEGIWSAAGWQDVTPQGVNVHWIWGSRRPDRGILAEQDPASANIEFYDPDRDLDPGNPDSPWYPQLVAGLPVRVSHESPMVIRTGIADEISYKHKRPNYRGQMLVTDTVSLLHKASVPADSVLGNTLITRVQDAIEAAGIGVGGIPLPPAGIGTYPTLSDWVEGAATDDPTSVWEIIRKACQEVLYVPFVGPDAGIGLRKWGSPNDRGREITASSLEDLETLITEDGVYSVVRVQPEDPDADMIEREAAPLPRYGRRVLERREPTINPESWATQVLQERSWPGVQYIPGAIHCFTQDDVLNFGSLQIMEWVTVTVPGVVSVRGRILGGELWVEHREGAPNAKWIFRFAVATDGSTAIGLTTLVSDQAGDTLLDDMIETDFLEAD